MNLPSSVHAKTDSAFPILFILSSYWEEFNINNEPENTKIENNEYNKKSYQLIQQKC